MNDRSKLKRIMTENITENKIKQNDYILTEYNKYNYCFHNITSSKEGEYIITNMLTDLNYWLDKLTIKEYIEELNTFINNLECEDIELILNDIIN